MANGTQSDTDWYVSTPRVAKFLTVYVWACLAVKFGAWLFSPIVQFRRFWPIVLARDTSARFLKTYSRILDLVPPGVSRTSVTSTPNFKTIRILRARLPHVTRARRVDKRARFAAETPGTSLWGNSGTE